MLDYSLTQVKQLVSWTFPKTIHLFIRPCFHSHKGPVCWESVWERERYLVHSSCSSHLRWAWKLMISCTLQSPLSLLLVVLYLFPLLFPHCALFIHVCFIQFVVLTFLVSCFSLCSISCTIYVTLLTMLGNDLLRGKKTPEDPWCLRCKREA